jgi:PKD repeat protein
MRGGQSKLSWLLIAVVAVVGAVSAAALPAGASGSPEAEISITPANGALAVTFTARSTGFPSAVVSFKWTFGDGAATTTTSHVVTHQYARTARFTPSVTETDGQGDKASASGTIQLFTCPTSQPTCTATLSNAPGIQALTASGPVSAAAAALDLFGGPFKISQCQTEVVPTAALTDTGFSGNLTVTLDYTSAFPPQAKTTCFASAVPFVDASGKTVKNGKLPTCAAEQTAPCVESTDISGSSVSKVLLIPPGDPKVGAP